jgi:hypothetical protein
MKKTQIIKYFTECNPQEYKAMIIIPLYPINLSTRWIKHLTVMLQDLIGTRKKIMKKKENEIFDQITSDTEGLQINRSFNVVINNEIKVVSPMHPVEGDEVNNIENYTKDMKNLSKDYKHYTKITYLIFEYIIKIKHNGNQTEI